MKDFKIEIPTAHDYTALTAVWEASVRATHHFLKEEDILFYKPLVLNEYLKAVDLYYIKNTDDSILGFMGTSGKAIEMLFIHPDARGKGIGKQLLRFAVERLGTDSVDVNEDNLQAIGFYQKMGFAVKGRSAVDGMGKPYPILHMELTTPIEIQ